MLSNDKLDAIREDWQMKYDHDISMCNDYIRELESKIERLRGVLSDLGRIPDSRGNFPEIVNYDPFEDAKRLRCILRKVLPKDMLENGWLDERTPKSIVYEARQALEGETK